VYHVILFHVKNKYELASSRRLLYSTSRNTLFYHSCSIRISVQRMNACHNNKNVKILLNQRSRYTLAHKTIYITACDYISFDFLLYILNPDLKGHNILFNMIIHNFSSSMHMYGQRNCLVNCHTQHCSQCVMTLKIIHCTIEKSSFYSFKYYYIVYGFRGNTR